MGQALYRKYRPRSFSETIGQQAIVKTLSEALKTNRLSHAYLFAGPRGVGKTSVARIMAFEVNNLRYSDSAVHLDIIEIDAASNRRIDEIRDLREKVRIAPAQAKYKVYIIDEVHMLTKEAFNALLKTLEEPPAHCIFILATTEPHKLPETIISRTQRFNFKPITPSETQKLLSNIAAKENIAFDDAAIELLSEYGDGSLRDTIGYLDQLSSVSKKISLVDVRELLGLPSSQAINDLLASIDSKDPKRALKLLDELKEQAASPIVTAKSIAHELRSRIIEHGHTANRTTSLLKDLLSVSESSRPQESLEIAVLAAIESIEDPKSPITEEKPPKEIPKDTISLESTLKKPTKHRSTRSRQSSSKIGVEQWPEILETVKAKSPALFNALRLSRPVFEDDKLSLIFAYPLHAKQVNRAENIASIGRIIEELSGHKLRIVCEVDKSVSLADENGQADHGYADQTINNIFGSTEVLES